jgi:hypothetical protein
MHRILVAAIIGLLAGLFLHRGLGLSFVQLPPRAAAAAPPADAGIRGAAEAQKLQALHDDRQEDLRKRVAAAEQECADLKVKVAAAPKTPREPSREEKVRNLGRLLTKMVRLGAGKPTSVTPEVQKMLAEFMKLCTELKVDMTNSSTMFKNPEFASGVFEGFLDEFGIADDPAVRQEWKAGVLARIQTLGDNPSSLRIQKVANDNLLDFYDRFGERLFEKDAASAKMISAMSAGAAVSVSQATRKSAADSLLRDVAKTAMVDEATRSRLQPVADRWAAEYAVVIADATKAHGEEFLSTVLSPDKLPESREAALAQIRAMLRFKGRAYELQARALEEMAAQLDPDAAARLRKFDRAFYFKRITD